MNELKNKLTSIVGLLFILTINGVIYAQNDDDLDQDDFFLSQHLTIRNMTQYNICIEFELSSRIGLTSSSVYELSPGQEKKETYSFFGIKSASSAKLFVWKAGDKKSQKVLGRLELPTRYIKDQTFDSELGSITFSANPSNRKYVTGDDEYPNYLIVIEDLESAGKPGSVWSPATIKRKSDL